MRKKIEQSGRDARWEFDRKKLFERTDHIAQICSDIHSVAQVSTHTHMYANKNDVGHYRQFKNFTTYLELS